MDIVSPGLITYSPAFDSKGIQRKYSSKKKNSFKTKLFLYGESENLPSP
jgi:hypothetical protein